ncbi:hypothetical protein AC578_1661 [Pseudocercospora eumusae]|uniref:Uncharacterized protein n=1 Tax=Pseudocercospora eumusae TaxID=321146 RepID=A0A139HM48_9PEZI|nr:hypothetical protein AC578_1661 [Pseudocercospora eumusae]
MAVVTPGLQKRLLGSGRDDVAGAHTGAAPAIDKGDVTPKISFFAKQPILPPKGFRGNPDGKLPVARPCPNAFGPTNRLKVAGLDHKFPKLEKLSWPWPDVLVVINDN